MFRAAWKSQSGVRTAVINFETADGSEIRKVVTGH